jgi:hypothetical protein
MEVLSGDVLYEVIFQRYARNQRGWSFKVSPSEKHGFFDAFVANGEEAWQLKFDTIFKPSPLVIGASAEPERQNLRQDSGRFSFGYRELQPSLVERLGAEEEGDALPKQLAALLASMKPVVPRPGKVYAQGPFILSGRGQAPTTRSQATLDDRLSSEMLRLVRNRYPGYG